MSTLLQCHLRQSAFRIDFFDGDIQIPSFSRPATRAPRRACSQATLLLDQKILFVNLLLLGKTEDLIQYLNALQFRNGPSFVLANQSFGWHQFCVLYAEPENISTIRFGWDTLGLRSYLFENPKDPKKQRSPPTGMRSAVPLGGLGKKLIPSLEAALPLSSGRATSTLLPICWKRVTQTLRVRFG